MKKIILNLFVFISLTANSQIENGMILHLPFNNNFDDISTSSVMLTNNGAIFGLDRNGVSNYALNFNNHKYVDFDGTELKTNFPITMSVWVNFSSFVDPQVIFTTDNIFENNYGYNMTVSQSGQVGLSIAAGLGGSNASNRRSFVSNSVLSTGQWHHVVGTIRDYNDMSIYIDCNESTGSYSGSGSTTVAYSASNSSVAYNIGNNWNPSGVFMDGFMDQLVIWNRELTPSELTFMCDSNNPLAIDEMNVAPKELIKIVDMIGRETNMVKNTPLVFVYSDGSTERVLIVE